MRRALEDEKEGLRDEKRWPACSALTITRPYSTTLFLFLLFSLTIGSRFPRTHPCPPRPSPVLCGVFFPQSSLCCPCGTVPAIILGSDGTCSQRLLGAAAPEHYSIFYFSTPTQQRARTVLTGRQQSKVECYSTVQHRPQSTDAIATQPTKHWPPGTLSTTRPMLVG